MIVLESKPNAVYLLEDDKIISLIDFIQDYLMKIECTHDKSRGIYEWEEKHLKQGGILGIDNAYFTYLYVYRFDVDFSSDIHTGILDIVYPYIRLYDTIYKCGIPESDILHCNLMYDKHHGMILRHDLQVDSKVSRSQTLLSDMELANVEDYRTHRRRYLLGGK